MRSLLLSFALLITISAYSQNTGIQFVKEDLEKAKTAAQADDKIIFVDAYTTWCGPCKMMDRSTFKDESVASFYNENFVNLKMDMEKGEGPAFAKMHQVRAYPSLLFLSAAGDLVHKSLGFQDNQRFLELGKAAIDPEQQVVTLQKRFEAGDRDKEFLAGYANAMTLANMDGYEKVTKAYLEGSDWTSKESIQFLFDFSEASRKSELFQYMIAHRSEFDAVVGENTVKEKIYFAALSDTRAYGIEALNKEALITHANQYFPNSGTAVGTEFYLQNLMYAPGEVNEAKYLSEVQLHMATQPEMNSQAFNSHAWRIYELTDERDLLLQAITWIDQSIALEENSYNTDTRASILYKLGKKKDALNQANRSVELAMEEGSDPTATKELIEKIKGL